MRIEYTLIGDYFLPNLKLSDPSGAPLLGLYGQKHKTFLNEHKPVLYSRLLLTEQLFTICREIDAAAETRLVTIPDKEPAQETVLAELKYN